MASRAGGQGMTRPEDMDTLFCEFAAALRCARLEETARLHNVIHGLEILRDGAVALRDEIKAAAARLRN
jgi:hypothetical protein